MPPAADAAFLDGIFETAAIMYIACAVPLSPCEFQWWRILIKAERRHHKKYGNNLIMPCLVFVSNLARLLTVHKQLCRIFAVCTYICISKAHIIYIQDYIQSTQRDNCCTYLEMNSVLANAPVLPLIYI